MAHGDRDLVLAGERNAAGQHLVEHDPQRVEVRLAGDRPPERLLGRDVVGRAQHPAVGGQPLLGQRAGDAEVGDLGAALDVHEDVLGLDVAVDDRSLVRALQRARDLDRVGGGLGDRQALAAPDALLERLALDVLEDDELGSVVLAGIDHGDDVGVVELGHRARLAPEALELVGVGGDLAVHQLDRDGPLEHRVEGAVDRRHAARADLGVEPVATVEKCADGRAQGIRWWRSCSVYCAPMDGVRVTWFTDPACPWSWAAEPQRRRLEFQFGEGLSFTYVMTGLARRFEAPLRPLSAVAGGVGAERHALRCTVSGWTPRPRAPAPHAWRSRRPPSRAWDPDYLRRARKPSRCSAAAWTTPTPSSAWRARSPAWTSGASPWTRTRTRSSRRSGPTWIAAASPATTVRAPTTPWADFEGADGKFQRVTAPIEPGACEAAAVAVGAQPLGAAAPEPEAALRRFGRMATAEVTAVCDLPDPQDPGSAVAAGGRLAGAGGGTSERVLWTVA